MLGPSDLYKVVKEVGKFIQNIRTLGTDLSTTFENNMESTLQLEELRKAQRELNDAFSFRRSINVDADSDAFSVEAGSAQKAEAATAAAAAAAVVADDVAAAADPTADRPKKIRRRVRKIPAVEEDTAEPDLAAHLASSTAPVVRNVPEDLEMPEISMRNDVSEKEAAEIEAEFDQYVTDTGPPTAFSGWDKNWLSGEQKTATALEPNLGPQTRFQQQLSGNWNDQILAVGDKLEPMALVMNKIALLEEEKLAAIRRLEEEFAKRTEVEEKYYQEQRKVLEEAATTVQRAAFGVDSAATKI